MGSRVPAGLIEVYRTEKGGVYQCDSRKCLFLDFGGQVHQMNFQAFNELKKIIDQVDLGHMCTLIEHADIEIILLREHCLVLSGIQIVHLKEIIQGSFTMFLLNHILEDCLHRLAAV